MISVSEYCKDNILVIPEALSQMQEVVALLQDGQSAIFYKQLENDLVNVEFYTNTPCFVYIEKGEEIITTPSNETFTLGADTAFFLPQGLNLHSDHFSSKHTLTAYLLFFSETVISQYLQTQPKFTRLKSNVSSLSVFHGGAHLKSFFGSIHLLHQQGNCVSELLNIKLQEFLHLMAMHNPQHCLPALLSHLNTMTPKRNLVRLMKNPETLRLTVKDLGWRLLAYSDEPKKLVFAKSWGQPYARSCFW